MLFNSLTFAVFLPIVFILYWATTRQSLRNLILLSASYLFYGWWEPTFLLLIAFSSLVDFSIGFGLDRIANRAIRRLLLGGSCITNLGLLFVFKYFDFFIGSFVEAFESVGIQIDHHSLGFILPVGISFYTFQTLSYTIDVYRSELKASTNPIQFFTFVAFFPQLVAGPIERASRLLHQFGEKRCFDGQIAVEGMRRILFGLFKKVVIADQCGIAVDRIFENSETMPGVDLLFGSFYFAFQIYCDFSGYSDIAIGTAKLFRIELMENFRLPYFSRNVGEFWRRWHISLSTWFRDYLYIPIGGSQHGKWMTIRNTLLVFIISGLWHGANWTFVVWGLIHWLCFLPALITGRNRTFTDDHVAKNRILPSLEEFFRILMTFSVVSFAWIFFRAESLPDACNYIFCMADQTIFSIPTERRPIRWITILVLWEWIHRGRKHCSDISYLPMVLRWVLYLVVAILILAFYTSNSEFIYFQF